MNSSEGTTLGSLLLHVQYKNPSWKFGSTCYCAYAEFCNCVTVTTSSAKAIIPTLSLAVTTAGDEMLQRNEEIESYRVHHDGNEKKKAMLLIWGEISFQLEIYEEFVPFLG